MLQSAFSILGPNQVAYVDLTGSGAETISHLYENGRIVVMFNSFDSAPRILRFWCSGHVIEKTDPRFQPLLVKMSADRFSAVRAIILLDVWKVSRSRSLFTLSKGIERARRGEGKGVRVLGLTVKLLGCDVVWVRRAGAGNDVRH